MADHHVAALASLSWNPSAPADVLLRLLKHDDRAIRRNVAQRRGLPFDVVEVILAEFARDPARRRVAARHPRLPVPLIRELLDDPETACAAAGNPRLPARDMHRLLDGAGVPV
ncbi:hypothetical protein OG539_07915 [Actinacidiphila glaucinigra]|uniref:hypothetical protein n=1 Tax=Actinacidiphila glaucinigra TaxID=235986 RepID=UPI002DD87B12|nr:hypothetical protein [Actinacidiphila glaucinigra]WSD63715.1 hypothetical protein OIE69_34900 [Actinacidiphila glaucinigra]